MRNKMDRWYYDNISERFEVEYDPWGEMTPEDGDGKKDKWFFCGVLL